MRTRCPKCNRFGTSELDGYCRACAPKPVEEVSTIERDDNRKHIVSDTYFETTGFVQGKFVPSGYKVVKETYGYENE